MLCRQCLRRTSFRRSPYLARSFATATSLDPLANTNPRPNGLPAATSTSPAPQFSTPLASDTASSKKKAKRASIPVSSCPAGTPLKGLNFFKGKEDPLALPEEEYPEWLWKCLEGGKKSGADTSGDGSGDEFSKSKKERRAAAKVQRKLEEKIIASGNLEALAPKIPLQEQSIDLPSNEEGTVDGALRAFKAREEVTSAMRQERRSKIKENNFLKGMR